MHDLSSRARNQEVKKPFGKELFPYRLIVSPLDLADNPMIVDDQGTQTFRYFREGVRDRG